MVLHWALIYLVLLPRDTHVHMKTKYRELYALSNLDKYGQTLLLWLVGVRLPMIPAISGENFLMVLHVSARVVWLAVVWAPWGQGSVPSSVPHKKAKSSHQEFCERESSTEALKGHRELIPS